MISQCFAVELESMPKRTHSLEQVFAHMQCTAADAAMLFRNIDEQTDDGFQAARQVLAHLVFWHREYVKIARSALNGKPPELRHGTYSSLNALAHQEFRDRSMSNLTDQFMTLQSELIEISEALQSRRVKLPFKEGGQVLNLEDWLRRIQAHVLGHVRRFHRVERPRSPGH